MGTSLCTDCLRILVQSFVFCSSRIHPSLHLNQAHAVALPEQILGKFDAEGKIT